MAFESYALYPQKTVAQNLASPLRSGRTGTYSEAEQKQRIDLVTTTLGINHLLERFPRELSNGQRQRVALGRVLVRPADVYLLDEPLSHLDAKLRAAMRAELKHLGDISNVTTFYVTHDYQEALSLGDRVGVLRQGRLVQIGTPEEVWNRPVDSFVAKALGQPEINIFDGVVEQGRIKAAGGAIIVPVPAPAPGRGALAAGDAVRVGLRPRDIEIVDAAHRRRDGGWLVMDGTVRLAERLGRLVELDIHVGDVELIVVAASEHARVEGDQIQVQIPLDLVYVFAAGEPDEDSAWLGSAAPPRQRREAADHSSSTRT
jgi:ABC-type sugar transport system ATPase subunit